MNVTLNGGAGIFTVAAGDSSLATMIEGTGSARPRRFATVASGTTAARLDAYGSYRDNEILSNESVGGQVIGGMSDEGGNNVH